MKLLQPFLSKQYLFEINRVMLQRSDKAFLTIALVLVALGIVFKAAELYAPTPVDKKLRGRLFNLFLAIGLLEAVWFGARYQNITFFGSHFAALLILLVGLVWLVFVIKSMIKNYRSEKQSWEKEQVRAKYLAK